ncbi:MAG: thioredoxin family protein [Sulfurimonas sp.]
MNKLIILLLMVISLWGIEFHSYDKALKMQKKSGKIIMVDIMRTECHFCQKMNKNVLQEKEMSKYLEKKFIVVKINLDHDKLPSGMHIDFTPTFYFLDTKQKIIKRVPGSWNLADFKWIVERIK